MLAASSFGSSLRDELGLGQQAFRWEGRLGLVFGGDILHQDSLRGRRTGLRQFPNSDIDSCMLVGCLGEINNTEARESFPFHF